MANYDDILIPEDWERHQPTSVNSSSGSLYLVAGPNVGIQQVSGTFYVSGTMGPNELTNITHQLTFIKDGELEDEWMKLGDSGIASNQSPAVMPWKSRLVGMTFTNKYSSREADIKIYTVPEGDGKSPLTKQFVWEVRDCRTACLTNLTASIIFDECDKVAVFSSDRGSNPSDVVVHLYFRVLSNATTGSFSEDYSGDFSLGGGGGTTT